MATRTKAVADDRTALDAPKRARKSVRPVTVKANPVHAWATAGVGLTLALSAWLNGLAFSQSAPTPLHGWVLGLAIPVLVLVFSRVSAILYQSGSKQLAYCGAASTVSMVVLSVQHCAHSIAMLTGEPIILAAFMSISIDCGLVVAEVASVSKKK